MSTRKDLTSLSTIATNEDVIRVLHLTDPHLFADPDGELRGAVTAASYQRICDCTLPVCWSLRSAIGYARHSSTTSISLLTAAS